ncbi:MAG: hypothetical protein ACLFV3_10870 [Phycisphaeraceae bacterium]
MPTAARRQPGFVLLMTLVLLALVAVVLVDVSRRSVRRAVESAQAVEDLQFRWAAASVRTAVLPRASLILEEIAAASPLDASPGSARLEIDMSGEPVAIYLSDEQGKANLNDVYRRSGPDAARRAARELHGRPRAELRIELAPDPRADQPREPAKREADTAEAEPSKEELPPPPLQPFGSWAQVYPAADVELLLDQPAKAMTLWGDGRINLRTADPLALRVALGPIMGADNVRRLVDAREALPNQAPPSWLAACQVDDDVRGRVQEQTVRESTCFGVAVFMFGRADWTVGHWLEPAEPRAAAEEEDDDPGPDYMQRMVWP